MGVVIKRFDVYLVNLDPTQGYEIQKTRPALFPQRNESPYWHRDHRSDDDKGTTVSNACAGHVPEDVLDQLRTVDKRRLLRRLGSIDQRSAAKVLQVLQEMFAL